MTGVSCFQRVAREDISDNREEKRQQEPARGGWDCTFQTDDITYIVKG